MEDRDDPILRDILDRAAEMDAGQRMALLDRECANNPVLRSDLELLLRALDNAQDFLTTPSFVEATATEDSEDVLANLRRRPPREKAGDFIGVYKLLQKIGEGGMAIVYLAEQTKPVRRRVALKLIKPGMDSAAVIARFEAERQALALMDHTNIARVFEAGTTDSGQPYFVMELVDGIPITRYCDSRRLVPRERLALFIPVCRAIQHAHQKGIIHRDIKPTNVLVCVEDDKPVPKVIDFGVAKALSQSLTEGALFTQLGSAVGTMEYMSPEQAEREVTGTDTRTDIYSLGVLLYELLTGTTPLDGKKLRGGGYHQMLRTIQEQETSKPSTRLSTSGGEIISLAALRQTEPKKLARMMAGDLDWIVMKCIEKERARRYETADALALDVTRYLNNDPVEASPPSAIYRLRKLAVRHRVSFGVVALLVFSLSAGLIVSGIGLRRAQRAEGTAQQQRGRAEEEQRRSQHSAAMLRLQQGSAFLALGKLGQAEGQFEEAYGELVRLKGDAWIADLGLWDLSRQANPPIAQWQLGSRRIVGTRFLPDGKSAIVLQEDGTLQRIEMPYGRVACGNRIQSTCLKLALSGDGNQAFISDDKRDLYAWSLDDQPPRLVQAGLGMLLAVDQTGEQTMHAIAGGFAIRQSNGRLAKFSTSGTIEAGAFLANRRFITAGSKGAGFKLWQSGEFKELGPAGVEFYRGCAISPDGKQAGVSTWTDTIQIYDLGEGRLKQTMTGHTGRISELAWSADQKTLFSASWDGSARAWNAESGTALRIFRGSKQPLHSIAASIDGYRVIAGGWDGALRLWDTRRVPAAIEFRCVEHSRWAKSFVLLCDERLLAVGEATVPTELYDRLTGIRLANLGANSRTSGLHRGGTQTELVYGSFDGTDVVYDLESQEAVGTLGTPQPGPELQTYSWRAADAPIALIWRRDKDLTAWNLVTRKPIRVLSKGHTNWQVNISPNGRFAMAFGDTVPMGIILYPIDSAASLMRASWGEGGASVFSKDGQFLLTRRYQVEASASVWRTEDLALVRTISDGESVFSGDEFWPDDRHILSITQAGDQVLRDAQTGEVLYTVSGLGFMPCRPTPDLWVTDRGFDLGSTIADLRWPSRRRQLLAPARKALEKIASGGEDADSLYILGRWFALHGVDDWAADLLTRARQRGATVNAEELAGCYARMGDSTSAAKEYSRAIASGPSSAQAAYLRLCLIHHQSIGKGVKSDPNHAELSPILPAVGAACQSIVRSSKALFNSVSQ